MHTYIFEADLHFFFWAQALPWVPPLRAALPTRYQCELSEAEINAYYDLPHPESPTLEHFPLSPTFRFPKKHAFNVACHMNLRDMFTNLRNICYDFHTCSIHRRITIAISILLPQTKLETFWATLNLLVKLRKDRMRKQKVSADAEDEEVWWSSCLRWCFSFTTVGCLDIWGFP